MAKEANRPRIPHDGVMQLAHCWFRAELMRKHLHGMREVGGRDFKGLDSDQKTSLRIYLESWLSALFVVVEGFSKLKLKDAEVQKLFTSHLRQLKKVRHSTYHFIVEPTPSVAEMIGNLNWAEDLHDTIGVFLGEVVFRKAHVEAIMELRKTKRGVRGPRA